MPDACWALPSTDHPTAQAASGKGKPSHGVALALLAPVRPIPGRSQRLITLEPVWTTCALTVGSYHARDATNVGLGRAVCAAAAQRLRRPWSSNPEDVLTALPSASARLGWRAWPAWRCSS